MSVSSRKLEMRRKLLPLAAKLRRYIEERAATGGLAFRCGLRVLQKLTALPLIGPNCHALLGVAYSAVGDYREAIRHYQAAHCRYRHGKADLSYQLGLAFLGAGDFRAAESCFRRILAPQTYWVYQKLGQSLLAQNRISEAEEILRQGLEAAPDAKWVMNELCNCLLRQAREGAALDELLQVAATAPPGSELASIPFPVDLLNNASVTVERAEAWRTLCERHPGSFDLQMFLGRMENQLGNYEEARRWINRASFLRWPNLPGGDGAAPTDRIELKKPTFLIIGQAKAGTTALFKILCTHPRVEAPLIKEPQFWSLNYVAGLDWYYAHFPPLRLDSGRISGEGSVTYFHHPEAPGRIAKELPGVKLILLLRDPVSRAYSHYWMHTRLGYETRNWEDVVDEDLAEWPNCPLDPSDLEAGRPLSIYLLQSAALPHLKRWLSHFPHEQLLILRTPELARDFSATLGRVCAFLELPPFVPRVARRVNEGRYSPMAPEIEQRLQAWFAPHQQALADFLIHL